MTAPGGGAIGAANNPWDAAQYATTFGFVSRLGDDLIDLLDPRPGETVLDLGCGTGRHAAAIAGRGCRVVGMDADEQMLAKARADSADVDGSHLSFVRADAGSFDLAGLGVEHPFDACFSNAALHWMIPALPVLRNVRGVLGRGGRFVAEMGGAGNIAALDAALREALDDLGLGHVAVTENFYPTIGEQASLLEEAGFRVESAWWFRRPTPLEPGVGASGWTRHFRAGVWAVVPEHLHAELGRLVDQYGEARGLLGSGRWVADYCRLRFAAVAV